MEFLPVVVAAEQETVGVAGEELHGMRRVAGEGVAAGAGGQVGDEIRVGVKKPVEPSAGCDRGRRVGIGAEVGIAADLAPETGGVTDEGGFRARLQRALKTLDGPAVPRRLEAPLAGLRVRQPRHVEMQHNGELELPSHAEEREAAGIVEVEPEFPLPADPHVVHVVRGLEQRGGVGPGGMRAVADHKALRVQDAGGEKLGERDARMRAVGQREGRVEIVRVLGRLLGRAEIPGKQPGVRDPTRARGTPFWQLPASRALRLAILDVPHSVAGPLPGLQLVEWGCHDRHLGLRSWPADAAAAVERRFGLHPVLGQDPYAVREFAPDDYAWRAGALRTAAEEAALLDGLLAGVDAKRRLACELLRQQPWDCLLAVCGESHAVGHQLWHVRDPRHPRHDPAVAAALGDPLKVQALLDRSQRTEKYSEADFLKNSGVPTLIDASHAIAHNKVIIIDGYIVLTGSFNFTKAAEEHNAENLLVINDPALANQYLQNWQAHADHSEPYERAEKPVERTRRAKRN